MRFADVGTGADPGAALTSAAKGSGLMKSQPVRAVQRYGDGQAKRYIGYIRGAECS